MFLCAAGTKPAFQRSAAEAECPRLCGPTSFSISRTLLACRLWTSIAAYGLLVHWFRAVG